MKFVKKYLELYNPRFILDPVGGLLLGASIVYLQTKMWDLFSFSLLLIITVLLSYGAFAMNEYGGYVIGTDIAAAKLGGTGWSAAGNAVVRGVVTPKEALKAAEIAYLIALILGLYLILGTGLWLLLPIGVFVAFTGAFYEAPPLKLTYRLPALFEILVPLGFTVFTSFTYFYVMTRHITLGWLWAISPALIAGLSIRVVASIPDYEVDKMFGRKTLVCYVGPKAAIMFVTMLNIASCLVLVSEVVASIVPPTALIALVFSPLVFYKSWVVSCTSTPSALNDLVRMTGLHALVGMRVFLSGAYFYAALGCHTLS